MVIRLVFKMSPLDTWEESGIASTRRPLVLLRELIEISQGRFQLQGPIGNLLECTKSTKCRARASLALTRFT